MVLLIEVIFGILVFGIVVFLTMLCVHLCIVLLFLICSSALCSCWLLFTCDKAEILLVLCCNLPDINLQFICFFYLDSADGVDILAKAFCSMGCV